MLRASCHDFFVQFSTRELSFSYVHSDLDNPVLGATASIITLQYTKYTDFMIA